MSKDSAQALTLAELPDLRRKTEAVSQFLRQQIAAHLETLRPLFAPERAFGKSAGGKVEVQGSERALSELQQSYRNFTRKPYDLPETFDTNWLTLVGNALELHPWEYAYQVQGKPVSKRLAARIPEAPLALGQQRLDPLPQPIRHIPRLRPHRHPPQP